MLGIIESARSGKSTLLKMMSRMAGPTEGRIEYNGRAGTLLEVGTGMHPESTGGDNIYLTDVLLGLNKRETDPGFDEIVDLSGVEHLLDIPVKRCSSRMETVLKNGGTAISFSHHFVGIEALCDTILYLVQGQMHSIGRTRDLIPAYRDALTWPQDLSKDRTEICL